MKTQLYLASQSPRRAELLQQLGMVYEIRVAAINEQWCSGESPQAYVQRLALEKAIKVYESGLAGSGIPVLGADTCIVLDGEVIGKPEGKAHGLQILQRLSGRKHEVLTAVAVVCDCPSHLIAPSARSQQALQLQWRSCGQRVEAQALNESRVEFRPISDQEITAYWDSGEPADKAGAYAIQGRGALFIRCIQGSYSGIMGLPLYETGELLRLLGVELLISGKA
ncbi:MAG: Maf family nucleotide pyrophosphatase [Gammaproteobacteria bacterium]|nr:Maf family nucleotide pyrophosphatase [Gammaproteobacteria bacterium]MDH5799724.1 Maf family nucleotide pyrophosphatase [Gammaproteobacteria bacterium]